VYEIPENLSKFLTEKTKLVLFPRLLDFGLSSESSELEKSKSNSRYKFYFRGNFYFGHSVYLFLLSRLSHVDSELLAIKGGFGKWSGSTDDYLGELLTPNLAKLNFLEREPSNFTLTERVWDSFATGGLVIAHVGMLEDPISRFFKPNVDYLPFRNLSELYFIFQMVASEDEVLNKVRDNGFRKFKQRYAMGNLIELLEK